MKSKKMMNKNNLNNPFVGLIGGIIFYTLLFITLMMLNSCKKEDIKPSEYLYSYTIELVNYTHQEISVKDNFARILEVFYRNGEKITDVAGVLIIGKNIKVKNGDRLEYQASVITRMRPRPVFKLVIKNLTLNKIVIETYNDTLRNDNMARIDHTVYIPR